MDALIVNAESGPAAAIDSLAGAEDRDSLNLLASFQLFANRLTECEETLSQIETRGLQDAETQRLRALLQLTRGDVASAQLSAQRALEAQPLWEAVQIVSAVVNYHSALSLAAISIDSSNILAIPNPVEWCLIKRDPDALDRLREAEKVFEAAAQREDRDRDRRRALQTWRLACLANDVERQGEAKSYFESLMDSDPEHAFAMMWGLARGYSFNRDRTESALKDVIASSGARLEHVLALVACFLSRNHSGKAQKLLDAHKDRFTSTAAESLWRHWYIQTLAAQGRAAEAEELLKTVPGGDQLREARTCALRIECRNSGEWRPLVEHLQDGFQETGNAKFLYELCEIHAQVGNWQALADSAEALVSKVDTADAVRLAAKGLFNAERFKECAELLGKADRTFSSGVLPYDLRRARMECLRRLGSIVEAKDEAEALAILDGSTVSLLDLIRVYGTQGDFGSISRVARKLLGREDLTSDQALRIAWQVRLEDPTVAEALWRRSVQLGLADDAVAPAWLLAQLPQFGPPDNFFEPH